MSMICSKNIASTDWGMTGDGLAPLQVSKILLQELKSENPADMSFSAPPEDGRAETISAIASPTVMVKKTTMTLQSPSSACSILQVAFLHFDKLCCPYHEPFILKYGEMKRTKLRSDSCVSLLMYG